MKTESPIQFLQRPLIFSLFLTMDHNGPPIQWRVYMITHDLCQKLILGLVCHFVWLFDVYNPPKALSGLANFSSQGSDPAILWALGPRTPPYAHDRMCIGTVTILKVD